MLAYVPALIFLAIALMIPVIGMGLGYFVRPGHPFANKLSPYECGIEPSSDARGRISVRFYIVAILFVVFDVETIFLFPWAVLYGKLAIFGLIEMVIFLGILIVGYFYIWKKGALEWV